MSVPFEVPGSDTVCVEAGAKVLSFLQEHRAVTVISGAGCSTESGIPDYRSPKGLWNRRKPITYQVFTTREERRKRYWARSMSGWSQFSQTQPNRAHHSLRALESAGVIKNLITQNVDELHQRAGHKRVLELHGSSHRIVCLQCSMLQRRVEFQRHLDRLNVGWHSNVVAMAPDGDAELLETDYSNFQVPTCQFCEGMLKTDVVFFGENVPKARVDEAMRWVLGSNAVLVVGSSLHVWSGFRFIKAAVEANIPCAAINIGPTRADPLLDFKVEQRCGPLLQWVCDRIGNGVNKSSDLA